MFDPAEKHENPPPPHPSEIQKPWDHAQMIERKILFRIALTRALYDQIRHYFFRGLLTPREKHENPPWTTPPEIQEPWDHAQMIERKILFRIALTRALYDQIRP